MKNKAIYIDDLHFEHKTWESEFEFEKFQISSFTKRLEEIVTRWTDKNILRQIEQFQNKFIAYNEVLDTLLHHIHTHESTLSSYAIKNPIAIDHVHFEDHHKLREECDMQKKLYNEMKTEFLRFLTQVM